MVFVEKGSKYFDSTCHALQQTGNNSHRPTLGNGLLTIPENVCCPPPIRFPYFLKIQSWISRLFRQKMLVFTRISRKKIQHRRPKLRHFHFLCVNFQEENCKIASGLFAYVVLISSEGEGTIKAIRQI